MKNVLYYDSNSTETRSFKYDWQCVSVGAGSSLSPVVFGSKPLSEPTLTSLQLHLWITRLPRMNHEAGHTCKTVNICHLAFKMQTLSEIYNYSREILAIHDDVTKWKHFPRYWSFVRGIHRSPEFPSQRPVTQSFDVCFFICAWINSWVNNRKAGDLRYLRAHYDVTVMSRQITIKACLLIPHHLTFESNKLK